MILYHPSFSTELSEYGINLPLRDDRSEKVFELLKEHFPQLAEANPRSIPIISLEDIRGIHCSGFVDRLKVDKSFLEEALKTYECFDNKKRYNEQLAAKPISGLRESILRQVSATSHALDLALENEFCFFLGGGMHHGHFDKGSGFCPLNDIVIALRLAQKSKKISKAFVIDTDAHFGDGTAQMTANDESIKTFSIHMEQGWPLDTEEGRSISSTIDVGIGVGEENMYLDKLKNGLDQMNSEEFDCAIVVAGADPHCDDELLSTQKLKLSSAQMLARDMQVYKWCKDKGIPQLWVMAGGYGKSAPRIYTQFILKLLHLMG
jgi:acetoin utilization deacetylase AcuC-like enzyme